jgi:hypothetical protein
MMRRLFFLCLLVGALAIPAGAIGQDLRVGPIVGWSVTTGDLSDVADGRWSAGAKLDYMLNETFAIGGSAIFHSLDVDENIFDRIASFQEIDASMSIVQITVDGLAYLTPPGKLRFKAQGSLGLYLGRYSMEGSGLSAGDPFSLDESETEKDFGAGGGIGGELRVGRTMIGLNAEFHVITDEDTSKFALISASLLFDI